MGLLARVESKANRIRAWEADDPRRKRRVYAAAYTVSFIVAAFVVLFVYPSNGRSIVWDVDGLEQFYPFFVYEGQWLREIAGNLFSGQGLQIPLFAYNLGYGMDIPSTLDVFFDPLNLLSGLCPERYSEYLFQFLIVFRLYLAGWAFSLFAFKFNTGRFATLLGALLYALGGTALAVAFWPASAWPMVLFPLVLVGVERMLAGKGPAAFVASVAAFFIISYYFSYMACLLLVAYCAVRVVQTGKGRRVKTFALWTVKFAGCVVLALMIAGFSLMPSIVGLLGVDRFVEARVDVPALYTIGYYLRTVAGFAGTANVGSDCYIGFGGMALLACVLLFMRRGGHRTLKAAFIVMTVMLLLPAVGSLMNGLNYATNRWVWAYALLVSFIVAKMLPDLLSLGKRDVKVLGIACLAYAAVCMAFAQTRNEATLAALAVLAVCLFAVSQTGWSAQARSAGIAVCLVAGLAVNAFYFVSPDEGGVGKRSVPIASLYSKLVDESPNHVVSEVDDDGLWRYDAPSSVWSRTRNDSLVLGLMGMDFYNSSYNSYVDAYHTELALTGTEVNFSYKSL